MAYDHNPTGALGWGDIGNKTDYVRANPGQWFLGVLDTANKYVFMLPSELETDDVHQSVLKVVGEAISKPRVLVPPRGWQSIPLKGRAFAGINSLPNKNAAGVSGGARQHRRVCEVYGLNPEECLGFAVVKFNDLAAQYIDNSQSLNAKNNGEIPADEMRTSKAKRPNGSASNTARIPHGWSVMMYNWLVEHLRARVQYQEEP